MSTTFDAKQHEIDRALASLGLKGSPPNKEVPAQQEILPKINEIFESAGAGIEEAAITIASAMADSTNPQFQLKAAELALRVHGIFKDDKSPKSPVVNINIVSAGGEQKTLLNLVLPTP